MSIQTYLQALPKAELHVHLEGSIQPATLLTLARRNGVPLPAMTLSGLREWFRFRDFDHFIEVYLAITRCLRTAEDYELIVHELASELARQNVKYAEVTFTPATHEGMGIARETFMTGLARGRERAQAEFGVELAWVFDIVRNAGDLRSHCDRTLEAALEGRGMGVVAFGLGGKEAGHPPEPFARWFRKAREGGLRSAPHAGETAGAESVRGAIEALGAERIGHGVRAIEDPELVRLLAERRIALEVCPTSNLRLGVYDSIASHPIGRLHAAGIPITINSDDPPLFNTTLMGEIGLLEEGAGLGVAAIEDILLNGWRFSFLPEVRRAGLMREFRESAERLRKMHGVEV